MSPYYWKVFAALIFVCWSAAGEAQKTLDQRSIYTFANWRIDYIRNNSSFVLVGMTTEGETSHIAYQCYIGQDRESLRIYVPSTVPIANQEWVRVTVWTKEKEAIDLFFANFKGTYLVSYFNRSIKAFGDEIAKKDELAISGHMLSLTLRETQSNLGISFLGHSFIFDVANKQAAMIKFSQLCLGAAPIPDE